MDTDDSDNTTVKSTTSCYKFYCKLRPIYLFFKKGLKRWYDDLFGICITINGFTLAFILH